MEMEINCAGGWGIEGHGIGVTKVPGLNEKTCPKKKDTWASTENL